MCITSKVKQIPPIVLPIISALEPNFFHDFDVDLKNEAKIEVQNAHMGVSAKDQSGTLEINSDHFPLTKTGSLGMRKITPT